MPEPKRQQPHLWDRSVLAFVGVRADGPHVPYVARIALVTRIA
ncbi:hypothetical protein [Pandoraea sputorum]|nr:hypothetical protein [Pandoraea sputorum]